MKNSKSQGSALVVVIVILAIAIIGALGYVAWNNFLNNKNPQSTVQNESESNSDIPKPSTTTYTNEEAGISFEYPSGWKVVEAVQDGNTPEWYASTVKVFNQNNEEVALLGTGGQIGGLCSEDAPFVKISTVKSEPVTIPGIELINFGYTIVETSETNYGVAYGLVKDRMTVGDSSVQCPGMSVNYAYYTGSKAPRLGGVTFGLWYSDQNRSDDPNEHKIFESLNEAEEYADSQEFAQVEKMIKSLQIKY